MQASAGRGNDASSITGSLTLAKESFARFSDRNYKQSVDIVNIFLLCLPRAVSPVTLDDWTPPPPPFFFFFPFLFFCFLFFPSSLDATLGKLLRDRVERIYNNNNSYIALYPMTIYELAALCILPTSTKSGKRKKRCKCIRKFNTQPPTK